METRVVLVDVEETGGASGLGQLDAVSRSRSAVRGPLLRWLSGSVHYVQGRPLLMFFVIVSVVVRVVFWQYTHRVWEDALITDTAVRNFWLGNGLTHHLSEPHVQDFSSPIGMVVDLIGGAVGRGVDAVRLASLVSVVLALVVTSKIGDELQWRWESYFVAFGYLSLDQLQIFFGMSGMESQIAVAVLLWSVYAFISRRWTMLGVSLGVALLTRPDFLMWCLIVGIGLLIIQRRAAVKPLAIAAIVALPWYLFVWIYYGSIIPHTVTAKNLYPDVGLIGPLSLHIHAFYGLLTQISPFYEYTFTATAPIPKLLCLITAGIIVILAIVGAWSLAKRSLLYLGPALFVAIYALYISAFLVPVYFMWYLTPVTAVLIVYSASGLSTLARARCREVGAAVQDLRTVLVWIVAVIIVVMYSIHIPYTFILEKRVQVGVEDAVRTNVGLYLNRHMRSTDAVVLEPPGYIGYYAFNKTTYDYPGLTSDTVTHTLERLPKGEHTITSLIAILRPTYLVLRPDEWTAVKKSIPGVAHRYSLVKQIAAPATLNLAWYGLSYFNIDTRFLILKKS